MPQGMVPVIGRMFSHRVTVGRRRPRRRGAARPVLGVALVLVGILAPVGSSHLPDAVAVDSPVSAQTVKRTSGYPSDCDSDPAPWVVDGSNLSECRLEIEPCLEDPLNAGRFLVHSTEFPDFCESSVLESEDSAIFAACTAMKGIAVLLFTVEDSTEGEVMNGCRVVLPKICPGTLVRVSHRKCRGVERRSWTCPDEFTRGNQFNVCYKITEGVDLDTNPVCTGGGPDFGILSCEEYVGGDFLASPGDIACSDYVPPEFAASVRDNTRPGAARKHWCEFDASMLRSECHAAGAACTEEWALCLKRESGLGGCSGIGDTINCRALQAEFADPDTQAMEESERRTKVDSIRLQGCEPCLLLPFQSTPDHCPDEIAEQAVPFHGPAAYLTLFDDRQDLGNICPDPPAGRVSWSSTHQSRLAVVNSPVILHLHDLPAEVRTIGGNEIIEGFTPKDLDVILYPDPEPEGRARRLALWERPDSSIEAGAVFELVNTGSPYVHECSPQPLPNFRVIVEELWPDDKEAIESLFGAGSVDWWHTGLDRLEQERRTKARLLQWLEDLTPEAQNEERRSRRENLSEQIVCNNKENEALWCRWVPTRPGYYKIVVAGAWQMSAGQTRGWLGASDYDRLEQAVAALAGDPAAREQVRRNLAEANLTPRDVGLLDTLDGLASPSQGDADSLFRASSDGLFYPFYDLRARSRGNTSSYNYTESVPIGLAVHEVRVATRAPNL